MSYGTTPRMQVCLDFIRAFIAERGYSPSYQEIADGIGLRSKNATHRLIHELRERGLIELLPNRSRSIRPTEASA